MPVTPPPLGPQSHVRPWHAIVSWPLAFSLNSVYARLMYGGLRGSLPCMEVQMEADAVPPSPETPVPAEIVHESGRTRITRLALPGGTVIRKQPLGPDAERRVRHEVAMLQRLRGVLGVAQLADDSRYPGSVMLADAGG